MRRDCQIPVTRRLGWVPYRTHARRYRERTFCLGRLAVKDHVVPSLIVLGEQRCGEQQREKQYS